MDFNAKLFKDNDHKCALVKVTNPYGYGHRIKGKIGRVYRNGLSDMGKYFFFEENTKFNCLLSPNEWTFIEYVL